MRAEIISVGTELLLGQIIDTNAPYLGNVLSALGIDVYYRVTVGDNNSRLADALKTALSRADIVITIGGLGPTQDDLTKETIAEVLNERMIMDPASEESLRRFFDIRGLHIAESNLKQALIPESGMAVSNSMGTAPGIIVDKGGKIVIALPGPPNEFIPMVDNSIAPYLSGKTASSPSVIKSRVLRVIGVGESAAEEMIKSLLSSNNPSIAPYAKSAEVHFRITAKASDSNTAFRMIDELDNKTREILGDYVYGVDEETLESVVVEMLRRKKLKLALAESCTGGLISNRITNIAGSSEVFLAGIVSYSNESKTSFLSVPEELIRTHGAVSPEVAMAMAEGAMKSTGADIAVSVTGIAGPDGATSEKPVGLVYIGFCYKDGVRAEKNIYGGSRQDIKYRTSQTALNMIRKHIMSHD
ncbi:MAG: competence/damage-inducible protein A [Armatimonadota bacterium]